MLIPVHPPLSMKALRSIAFTSTLSPPPLLNIFIEQNLDFKI